MSKRKHGKNDRRYLAYLAMAEERHKSGRQRPFWLNQAAFCRVSGMYGDARQCIQNARTFTATN